MVIIAYFTNQGNLPKHKITNVENKKKTPNQLKDNPDNQIHIVVKMTIAFKKTKPYSFITNERTYTYVHYYLLVKTSIDCNKIYRYRRTVILVSLVGTYGI